MQRLDPGEIKKLHKDFNDQIKNALDKNELHLVADIKKAYDIFLQNESVKSYISAYKSGIAENEEAKNIGQDIEEVRLKLERIMKKSSTVEFASPKAQVSHADVKQELKADEKVNLETSEIPYVHKKVNLADLEPNGKLLDDKTMKGMVDRCKEQKVKDGIIDLSLVFPPDGKNDKDIQVIKDGDRYFAIYGATSDDKALGKGAFGEVRLMQDLQTGEWMALKKQKHLGAGHDSLVQKENQALEKVGELKYTARIQEPDGIYLLTGMKLAKGVELYEGVIKPKRKFPTVRWFDMSLSMLLHLDVIHLALLLHRDIKPENMLFDTASHEVRIVDLGLSGVMDEKKTLQDGYMGTAEFIAPEILAAAKRDKNSCVYNESTEVYAMGGTLIEMFGLGERVYNYTDKSWSWELYREGDSRLSHCNISDPEIRKLTKGFIKDMISVNPATRPTVRKAMEFFSEVRELQLKASDLVNRVVYLDISEQSELIKKLGSFGDELEKQEERVKRLEGLANHYQQIIQNQDNYISKGEIRLVRDAIKEMPGIDIRLDKERIKLDLLKKKINDESKNMLTNLQKADEVWLLASDKVSDFEVIKAKRCLEKVGMIVNGEALKYKNKENIPDTVKAYAKQREDKDKNIYLCAGFDMESKLHFPEEVSPRYVQKIIESLEKDKDRLSKKDAGKGDIRSQDINAYILKLKNNTPPITYKQLDKDLGELQKKMLSKNVIVALKQKYRSTAYKEISKLKKEAQSIQGFGRSKL